LLIDLRDRFPPESDLLVWSDAVFAGLQFDASMGAWCEEHEGEEEEKHTQEDGGTGLLDTQ